MNTRDPVAVVGMACRFSSVPGLEDFWALLIAGKDAMRPVPSDRYDIEALHDPRPGTPERLVSLEGGFLEDVRGFDAELFGISRREAVKMDPQHRLLLEVSRDAIEDAGIRLERIAGARAGVFVGLFTGDYRERMFRQPTRDLDVYAEIGTTRSSASGRIAHAFNLTGPTVAVDAACASSLVAVHLAAASIRSGESEMALAAGSNVILEPETTLCFSRSGMLSPYSRCRFGDAAAAGFVRSEGIGVVVLKPLSRAIEDGDRIYALIRASAFNNDGRQGASLYMTPSREGQKALLHEVYGEQDGGLDHLHFVEAHGTGTRAGDPVECEALASISIRRPEALGPLRIGSVKTNIGHAEGAAGIAGFIKAALSLYHRTLPPSIHFETPNPDIPWEKGRLKIPTTAEPLPATGTVVGGVSSFGLSGTNAHIALETYDAPPASAPPRLAGDTFILPVSAHRPDALRTMLERYYARIARLEAADGPSDPQALHDLCYTASNRRSHLAYRFAAAGPTAASLLEALMAGIENAPSDDADPPPTPKTAFIFPGQGGQWTGMALDLLNRPGAFRETILEIDARIREWEGWSVLQVLESDTLVDAGIDRLQPALFALQIGLAAQWKALGIHPDAVVGHSMGEVAAAHVAGALDLPDALRVILERSKALARIAGRGAMGVIGLPPDDVSRHLVPYADRLSIAVINAPTSTVVSGDPDALTDLFQSLEADAIFCRAVRVDVASHSPQTDPLLDDLRAVLADCRARPTTIPLYSTVEGGILPGDRLDADYWARNMRSTVRFHDACTALLDDGFTVFIEAGPHPVLLGAVQAPAKARSAGLEDDAPKPVVRIPSMQRDCPARQTLMQGVASAYGAGLDPNWAAVHPPGRVVTLPGFAFVHEPYWFDEDDDEAGGELHGSRRTSEGIPAHPLLPRHIRLATRSGMSVWEVGFSLRRFPWLADHRVRGILLLPGATYVELALAVAAEVYGDRYRVAIEGLELMQVFEVPDKGSRTLQIQLEPRPPNLARLRFLSIDAKREGDAEITHARAMLHLRAREDDAPSAAEHAADPSSAAILERIELELERLRHNPTYRFGLLALAAPEEWCADPDALSRVGAWLRRGLRVEDMLSPVAHGEWMILLHDVPDPTRLRQAALRIRAWFVEALEIAGGKEAPHVTLTGTLVTSPKSRAPQVYQDARTHALELPAFQNTPSPPPSIDADAFYASFDARRMHYGPSFRGVTSLQPDAFGCVATLTIPPEVEPSIDTYAYHPALLDACFQAAAAAALIHPRPFEEGRADAQASPSPEETATWLPVSLRRIMPRGRPAPTMRLRAWLRRERRADATELEVDLLVSTPEGRAVLEAEGLTLQLSGRTNADAARDDYHGRLYLDEWIDAPPERSSAVEPRHPRRVLFIGDEEEATWIRRLGERVDHLDVHGFEAWRRDAPPVPDVPPTDLLLEYRATVSSDEKDGAANALSTGAMETLTILRHVHAWTPRPRLWLLSRSGTEPTTADASIDAAHASLSGLARVIRSEKPEIELRLLDRPTALSEADEEALIDAILHPDAADESAISEGKRWIRLLKRFAPGEREARVIRRRLDASSAYALHLPRDLRRPWIIGLETRREPAPDELIIQVRAAALIPTDIEHGDGALIGCAGIVVQVGESVPLIQPGQAMMAVDAFQPPGTPAIGRYLTVKHPLAVPLPSDRDFDDAAAAMVTLVPAWLEVLQLGRLKNGERILVHPAWTPRGRCLIPPARAAGAQVFALGETLGDRRALRRQGADVVLDPASPALAEEIADLTSGQGIDALVLGPGAEHARPLLDLLRSGGRVIDAAGMARRDPELPGAVAARGLVYAPVNLPAIVLQRPGLIREALDGCRRWLDETQGKPTGAPHRILNPEALQGGLPTTEGTPNAPIVIPMNEIPSEASYPLNEHNLIDPDGTWLIAGGTGGLGLTLVNWLMEKGARHFVLISRRGENEGNRDRLDTLRRRGARLMVRAADIGDHDTMREIVEEAARTLPPITGIAHLAAVLRDGTLETLTRETFLEALKPRVDGALVLDALSRTLPVHHFLLFGSAAATLGSPGQANYAMANAFLEAIAIKRTREGLPALCIAWGTWDEVGLAAQDANRGARLASRGLLPMAPTTALKAMAALMTIGDVPTPAVMAMEWTQWAKAFPWTGRSRRLSGLAQQKDITDSNGALISRRDILEAKGEARHRLIIEALRRALGEVLNVDPGRISPRAPLSRLGLDSLMAVELRTRLVDQLGVELATSAILHMLDVRELATAVNDALRAPSRAKGTRRWEEIPAAALNRRLDPGIQGLFIMPPRPDPRVVLLTGATGFLGIHVLSALLERTDARIRCLVRARSDEEALGRLRQSAGRFRVRLGEVQGRLEVCRGDLASPRFGMTALKYEALGADLDAIYHCAAHVNHLQPYDNLAPTNVDGTEEILRMAAMAGSVSVHHVSTMGIFPVTPDPGKEVVLDEGSTLPERPEPFFGGYAVSKWVAERLIREARQRTLNVNVYRPAAITGSTQSGICPSSDLIWQAAAAAVAAGIRPGGQADLTLTPVDFVAEALVKLSLLPRSVNADYHLVQSEPVSIDRIFDAMEAEGYRLRRVPLSGLRDEMRKGLPGQSPLWSLISGVLDLDLEALAARRIRLDASYTMNLLDPVLKAKARIDDPLLTLYIRRLIAHGALRPPGEAAESGDEAA